MNSYEKLLDSALNRYRLNLLPDREALRALVKSSKADFAATKSALVQKHAANVHVVAQERETATIRFDGELLDVPEGFEHALACDEIHLVFGRANGGCGGIAREIISGLRNHPRVSATILRGGHAISAHALIFLAANSRIMRADSRIMLHGPALVEVGNLAVFREAVKKLEAAAEQDIRYIRQRTKQPREVVERWILSGDDHWFSEAEAAAFGLARVAPSGE